MKNNNSKNKLLTAKEWNDKYPPGTIVVYTNAIGDKLTTYTRSEAWELGHGDPVVLLHGRAGGYALEFLTVVED